MNIGTSVKDVHWAKGIVLELHLLLFWSCCGRFGLALVLAIYFARFKRNLGVGEIVCYGAQLYGKVLGDGWGME